MWHKWRGNTGRWELCPLLLAITLAGTCWAQTASTKELSETQVKAAFLFNFIKFVEWPSSSFSKPNSAITVCTIGSDDVAEVFEGIIQGKEIGGRPIVVRRPDATGLNGCHVVYIGGERKRYANSVLEQVKGQSILTVGDIEQFARAGGIISLTTRDNKVRFAINPQAGARASLRISSKLLSLATIVGEHGEGN
jgi:hypothetical protein